MADRPDYWSALAGSSTGGSSPSTRTGPAASGSTCTTSRRLLASLCPGSTLRWRVAGGGIPRSRPKGSSSRSRPRARRGLRCVPLQPRQGLARRGAGLNMAMSELDPGHSVQPDPRDAAPFGPNGFATEHDPEMDSRLFPGAGGRYVLFLPAVNFVASDGRPVKVSRYSPTCDLSTVLLSPLNPATLHLRRPALWSRSLAPALASTTPAHRPPCGHPSIP